MTNKLERFDLMDMWLDNILSPEVWMLLSIYILFVYGIVKITSSDAYFLPKMHILSIILLCCMILLVCAFPESCNSVMFRNVSDSIVEVVILFISVIIFITTYEYNKSTGILSFEYYIIMLICICSFCIFIHSNDIILMYVLIELQSICSYLLTAINKNKRSSIEAGIKYFIIGSFSSIILLFGFSFLYGFTGLVDIYEIATYIRFVYAMDDGFFNKSMLFSLLFVNIGLLFKIYAAPFHFWVSDIYNGSPMSVTMFLATIPVLSYVYMYIKLYVMVFSDFFLFYKYILPICAIASILLGVIGALVQRKIKKLIAYSSVATVGYILAGVSGDNILLVHQSILYLFIYIINIVPIFIILLNYRINNEQCIDSLRHFSALYAQNPMIFFMLCVFFFSLAGVPPFSGFLSKLFLFTALVFEHMYTLLLISVLFTLIGCYNYIRIIKLVIYDKCDSSFFYSNTKYSTVWILWFFVFVNVFFIYLFNWVDNAFLYIAISLYF